MSKVSANAIKGLKIFHFVGAIHFAFSCYYDYTYVNVPRHILRTHVPFGGKFKYLTFLNAIIQALYFTIALLNDIFGSYDVLPTKKLPIIRRIKDYMFSSLAFPVALNVGITFWSLFWIDRELVFPKALDEFFPRWLNHSLHTNILLFIIMELFTSFRKYPKRKVGLAGLSFFMLSYLVWIHVIKHYSGVWVYPVLDVLNIYCRILFFIGILGFSIGLYVLGEFANENVWIKEIKQSVKARKAQ